MKKRKDLPYLNHILDAIHDIEESVRSITKDQFMNNKDIRDANIRRIEIIGEAVKSISSNIRKKYVEVEWSKIAATRDKMIHHYFGVDLDIVWNIITRDLPKLKLQIVKIKKDMEKKLILNK